MSKGERERESRFRVTGWIKISGFTLNWNIETHTNWIQGEAGRLVYIAALQLSTALYHFSFISFRLCTVSGEGGSNRPGIPQGNTDKLPGCSGTFGFEVASLQNTCASSRRWTSCLLPTHGDVDDGRELSICRWEVGGSEVIGCANWLETRRVLVPPFKGLYLSVCRQEVHLPGNNLWRCKEGVRCLMVSHASYEEKELLSWIQINMLNMEIWVSVSSGVSESSDSWGHCCRGKVNRGNSDLCCYTAHTCFTEVIKRYFVSTSDWTSLHGDQQFNVSWSTCLMSGFVFSMLV